MAFILAAQIYQVIMFLRYAVAFPACVIEDLSPLKALARSVALTRGGRGRIFLVLLVLYAATYALIMVAEMVLFMVGGIAALAFSALHIHLNSTALILVAVPCGLLLLAIVFVMMAASYAAYATALCVLYCDQRVRHERLLPPPIPAIPSPAGDPA
jgi:hypothetical protein